MNQKLSDWAAVAEIVSGIAVVVTLVTLIIGIRENTDVTRASMFQVTTGRLIEWRNKILEDPEVARIYGSVLEPEQGDISYVDSIRRDVLMLNVFQIYEQAYFANEYGYLGQQEWARFEQPICDYFSLATDSPWGNAAVRAMTEEFATYMEESCAN